MCCVCGPLACSDMKAQGIVPEPAVATLVIDAASGLRHLPTLCAPPPPPLRLSVGWDRDVDLVWFTLCGTVADRTFPRELMLPPPFLGCAAWTC